MTQVYEIEAHADSLVDESQAEQFVENLAVLLGISGEYASAWEIANQVCDRYHVGIAA